MQESSTYQALLEERAKRGEKRGQIRAKRDILLLQGEKLMGSPTEKMRGRIAQIASLERLDELLERVLDAKNWDDLLSS